MIYELWHTSSGNALSEHRTLPAAIAAVREALARDGDRAVDGLALIELDERGKTKVVAEGADILAFIDANAPTR